MIFKTFVIVVGLHHMRIGSEIRLEDEQEFGADAVRLDVKNLTNLVKHGEGQRLEFKMKVKFPEKIIRELVAFANSDGGHLFIGVGDNGAIEGLKYYEEEQFLLDRAIEKYCFPPFKFHAYPIELGNGRCVLVYQVFESLEKPHAIQLETNEHPTFYVRAEDRSVQASKEIRQILRRQNDPGVSFQYGDAERWLMEYLHQNATITLTDFATKADLPRWLAARKLILLVLSHVLQVDPDELGDRYYLPS